MHVCYGYSSYDMFVIVTVSLTCLLRLQWV